MSQPNQPKFPLNAAVAALCFLVFPFCGLAAAQAQHASAKTPLLKYDLKAEKKLNGVIQDMKLMGEGRSALMHLVLKSGTDTFDVYLCPQQFIKDMGIELKTGDTVEIKGSTVLDNGKSVILAREVTKGTDTYVLRDDKGVPVWNWQHT